MSCRSKNKALCIDAGELRHRITIQAKMRTPDGIGGGTLAWSEVGKAWASIMPYRGLEVWRSMQTETPVSHKIRMRHRNDVTTRNRILFGTRVFDIVQCINVAEENIVLELLCVEGTLDA
ncbi:phage head closure protein (plasmid) [Skermanella rosea]|uniref:phage head closure protein n=1 Tax=Skermanella rosea TaxID=1817965 RepID=UPI001931FFE3|nr:phage head closure protein [Skermanella rosea]UEM08068.1 phage head closure protein [Skermanella rosea]